MTKTQEEQAAYHLSVQTREIAEMTARTQPIKKTLAGLDIVVFPKVYPGGIDSELMCEVLSDVGGKSVLDICTGTGIVALKAVQNGASEVVGIDLNPEAVKNAEVNKKNLGMENVEFLEGSLFNPVANRKFDIITMNPPYTGKKPSNKTEICFWDEDNQTTRDFFKQYINYLNPGGKAFLGWANFSSIELIKQLAAENSVTAKVIKSESTPSGLATFLVYELVLE